MLGLKTQNLSLEDLMITAQTGDKKAYRQVFEQITPIIRSFIAKRINKPEDIDEITQEILISVHKASQTYDPSRPFKAWLYAIIKFRLSDYLRSVYRKAEKGLDSFDEKEFEISSHDNSENAFDNKEMLEKMLTKLTKKQQDIIRMTKIDGFSMKETAEKMKMSESAVKVSVHRALDKLKVGYEGSVKP
jgi:RNA polymerase sigma-70 factor (ECF subfamily)